MRLACLFTLVLALASCVGEPNQDLKQWVQDSGRGLLARIDPLPEMKSFETFAYNTFDVQEPFQPRKLIEEQKKGQQNKGPDLVRRKEMLESYPLEQLRLVGTLEQRRIPYALIQAENTIHRVRQGNYAGQNFGLITEIGETEVKLKESIQDSEGDWKEHEVALQLIAEQENKK